MQCAIKMVWMVLVVFFFFKVFFICPYMIDPFGWKWSLSIGSLVLTLWFILKMLIKQMVCEKIYKGKWVSDDLVAMMSVATYRVRKSKNSKVLQNLFVKLMIWFSGDSGIYSKSTVTKGRMTFKYMN